MVAMSRLASTGDLLVRRCEGLVASEMARLARRVPALRKEHLGHVEATLGRVIDRLVMSRARSVGADELTVLFDLADEP